MPWLLIATWAAILGAVIGAYIFGRLLERVHWIKLLKDPPDPQDMEWFERRVALPLERRRMNSVIKTQADADRAAGRFIQSRRMDPTSDDSLEERVHWE